MHAHPPVSLAYTKRPGVPSTPFSLMTDQPDLKHKAGCEYKNEDAAPKFTESKALSLAHS
jgi:hypothetical protein